MLVHFGHARLTPDERERERRSQSIQRKADRVIEEYRKLDGALRIYVDRKPR